MVPTDLAGEQLISLASVSAVVGLRRTAIYQRIEQGTFPAQLKLSPKCSRWRSKDILAWLQAQGASHG